MSTLATVIQRSFGSSSHGNQRRKRKGIQVGKEEVKPSLFADDMTLYIDNPKDATRKLLRASLVAQWLRVRLPVQGTRVRAVVQEDPTCCGATKPVSHNY